MGQKIDPTSLRLKQKNIGASKWFLKENYARGIHNDRLIREYILNFLTDTSIVPIQVVIKRRYKSIDIYIYVYSLKKPGFTMIEKPAVVNDIKKVLTQITGLQVSLFMTDIRAAFFREGANTASGKLNYFSSVSSKGFKAEDLFYIEKLRIVLLRKQIEQKFNQYRTRPYFSDVFKVLNAAVMSRNTDILSNFVAQHLEKDFRHNMFLDFLSKVIQEYVTFYPFLEGVRIQVKGRVNGAERYRKENFQSGRISLQTITNKIVYCYKPVYTIYGVCGLKIWFCFKK